VTRHVVDNSESLQSIALRYGLLPETIWNHGPNAALKKLRREQYGILLPGDVLEIPERRLKVVELATGKRHTLRVKNRVMRLRVRFLVNRKPRSRQTFAMEVDGAPRDGVTDADGWLDEAIPVATKRVRVVFDDRDERQDPGDVEEHVFRVGALDPIDHPTGLQARLRNLGFYPGKIDGHVGEVTVAAIRAFQRYAKVPATGEVDDVTRSALELAYGA
jgi:hypothetical protein